MKKMTLFASLITPLLLINLIKLNKAKKTAYKRLEAMHPLNTQLEYGKVTYIDNQYMNSEVILSSHGLFGGYDQAFNNLKQLKNRYRIIAPSRFGYLGSDILGNGTPEEQSKAFKLLLDKLNVDKVYLFGTSAGGTPVIRFALDYPEYVKGVILFCSAHPLNEAPKKFPSRMGPPKFINNDLVMWLISPFFKQVMGMPSETIYEMLPISERKVGVELDITITNPDMSINYEQYDIESINSPVLIVHSKDDKLAHYKGVSESMHRYTNVTTCIFENGGHLMRGHETESECAVIDFIESTK